MPVPQSHSDWDKVTQQAFHNSLLSRHLTTRLMQKCETNSLTALLYQLAANIAFSGGLCNMVDHICVCAYLSNGLAGLAVTALAVCCMCHSIHQVLDVFVLTPTQEIVPFKGLGTGIRMPANTLANAQDTCCSD
eukprot:GHUV01040879.1.p1 GENE.GHUV01040879.1~~GHUV01040879.1.p1  ORF type:complete len:134 (-),score=17.35 GHUV01040879.1:548-949(-)